LATSPVLWMRTTRLQSLAAFVSPTLNMSASAANPQAAPLHVARCLDKPDSVAVREGTRAAHLEWATNTGALVFGARFIGDEKEPWGSLIILRGDTDDVNKMLSEDPYKLASLWSSTEVRRWTCGMRSTEPLAGASSFCVWCIDKANQKELRAKTRPAHLDWWRAAGRTGMIGPFPASDGEGAVGTMIVCEGRDLDDVKSWSATDPYAKAGLFTRVEVDQLNVTCDDI
jgi:uncharacterized protein